MGKNSRGKRSKRKQQAQSPLLMYGGVLAVVAVIGAYIGYTLLTAPPEVSAERLEQEAFLGTGSAPITIIEYGAYGCHSCRDVHQAGILDQAFEQYGDSIQLIFRNAPIIHRNDEMSAEAAQCVLDQGNEAFWQYHNALFELTDREYDDYDNEASYIDLANELGIDADALEECFNNDTHKRTVDHWADNSSSAGVNGTPTFFVNGQRLGNVSQLDARIRSLLG